MQLNRKQAEKEAAIDATAAVNKINRKGKSTAPVPPIKGLPHLRERNGLPLKLKLLCNSSKVKLSIMSEQFLNWRHRDFKRDRGARGLKALLDTEVWCRWKFHCCNSSDLLAQQLNQHSASFTSISCTRDSHMDFNSVSSRTASSGCLGEKVNPPRFWILYVHFYCLH